MKKFVAILVLLVMAATISVAYAELRVSYGHVRSTKVGEFRNGDPIFDSYYYVGIDSEIGETYEIEVTKDEYENIVGHSFDENYLDKRFELHDTYQEATFLGKTTRYMTW